MNKYEYTDNTISAAHKTQENAVGCVANSRLTTARGKANARVRKRRNIKKDPVNNG